MMPEQTENYMGHDIKIDENQNSLTIGDKIIDVSVDELGKYSTSFMPYTDYDSITDLAKQVIQKAADFDTLSGDQ